MSFQAELAAQQKVAELEDPRFAIRRETTFFTEPMREDGLVDYPQVIHDHYSRGITPQTNAVVLLYQATGRLRQPDAFFESLGVPAPDDQENEFHTVPRGQADAYYSASSKPWTAESYPYLAKWLEDNRRALDSVVEASLKSDYYSPWIVRKNEPLVHVLFPGLQCARELARAIRIRAMLRLGENDLTASWNDLMVVHRLGRLVGKGPSFLDRIVGISIEEIAIEGELQIISSRPDSSKLALYVLDLDRLVDRHPILDFGERLILLDAMCRVAVKQQSLIDIMEWAVPEKNPRIAPLNAIEEKVDWNAVLTAINASFDALEERLQRPTYQEQMIAWAIPRMYSREETERLFNQQEAVEQMDEEALTQLVVPWLVEFLTVPPDLYVQNHYRIEQKTRNLRVAFALAQWYQKNGSYPESLDLLDSQHQDAEPIDLFSSKRLIYHRTENGCRFYSVGINATDDQGAEDDLVVSLGLAPSPSMP